MPKLLEVELDVGEKRFPFQLCHRELLLGPAGPVDYYWMDSRKIRQGRGGPSFRPCVDLWWTAVEMEQATSEFDNELNLVLAESYPLVNTSRAVQDVYVDAHLNKMADRKLDPVGNDSHHRKLSDRMYLLSEEEDRRLRELAASRDSDRIREELEGLFQGELPPEEELPAFQEAARAWIGNGIQALRVDGTEGLRDYVQTLGVWVKKYRKRGQIDRTRMFLNPFVSGRSKPAI